MTEHRPLTRKNALLRLVACWVVAFVAVTLLRNALIPSAERECYSRVRTLDASLQRYLKGHPDASGLDRLTPEQLVREGLLSESDAARPEEHYYFIEKGPWGWRARCNRHQDNPLVLRLTGVTLLSLVFWVAVTAYRRERLF